MSGVEIVGLASSILQVADLGWKLSYKLYAFSKKIHEAGKTIELISQDISATGAILKQLGDEVEKDEKAKPGARLCSQGLIDAASKLIEECEDLFSQIDLSIAGKDGNKVILGFRQKLKWSYLEPRVELLRTNLERLKSSLAIMLNVLIYAEQLKSREEKTILTEQQFLVASFATQKVDTEKNIAKLNKTIKYEPSVFVNKSDTQVLSGTEQNSDELPVFEDEKLPSQADVIYEASNTVHVQPPQYLLQRSAVNASTADLSQNPLQRQLLNAPAVSLEKNTDGNISGQTCTSAMLLTSAANTWQPTSELAHLDQHRVLIEKLLEEINSTRYAVDHGVRYRLHDGVLDLHWQEWASLRDEHGDDTLRDLLAQSPVLARHWHEKIMEAKLSLISTSESSLGSQWPLSKVLTWLSSEGFSTLWTEVFRTLSVHGDQFLQLGRPGKATEKQFQEVIYPQLQRLRARNGTGAEPYLETERLKYSIRTLSAVEMLRPVLRSSEKTRPELPGTSAFSKDVHFDSHLESIQHFGDAKHPLASSSEEDSENESRSVWGRKEESPRLKEILRSRQDPIQPKTTDLVDPGVGKPASNSECSGEKLDPEPVLNASRVDVAGTGGLILPNSYPRRPDYEDEDERIPEDGTELVPVPDVVVKTCTRAVATSTSRETYSSLSHQRNCLDHLGSPAVGDKAQRRASAANNVRRPVEEPVDFEITGRTKSIRELAQNEARGHLSAQEDRLQSFKEIRSGNISELRSEARDSRGGATATEKDENSSPGVVADVKPMEPRRRTDSPGLKLKRPGVTYRNSSAKGKSMRQHDETRNAQNDRTSEEVPTQNDNQSDAILQERSAEATIADYFLGIWTTVRP